MEVAKKKKIIKKKAEKKKTGAKRGFRMTPNRELICQAIAENPNKNRTEIYLEVFPNSSRKAAAISVSRLMSYDIMKSRVNELLKPSMDKLDISIDRTMTELARGGYYDPALIYDEDNCILPVRDMPIEIRAAIASVEVTELFNDSRVLIGYTKKVKFHNKPKNLELLGKTNKLSMFSEHIKIDEIPIDEQAINNAKKDIAKDIAKELAKINRTK